MAVLLLAGKLRPILILLLWLVSLGALALWLTSARHTALVVGGGPADSESYALATVIADTLNESQKRFSLQVFDTGGSAENLRLLQSGQLDLAEIQADSIVPDGIVGVAKLYHDAYHLIVQQDASIASFADLVGHRVAIPPVSSGQNASFWFMAEHFGLSADEFLALPMSEPAANFAMVHGQVDAVFRVRSPGNGVIRELIGDHPMRLVAIDQSEALALRQPALQPGVIPRGSYRGAPALPVADTPTAVLDRLLVTRSDMDTDVIYRFTKAMFDQRSDLREGSRLAGFLGPIAGGENSLLPLHPGALRYYDREKPSFMQSNVRLLSALLYTVAILVTSLFALRAHWKRLRRIQMGGFNARLMEIAHAARHEEGYAALVEGKHKLVDILSEVVADLDRERVSQEEFEHFSFAWQAVDALVRDRLMLMGPLPHVGLHAGVEQ
jgi:TRAP transporter TAXI family solute receptor